ncbi:MAG: alpha/beta hydrolase [Desulfobacterales bacterium]|nr:alpha/beta hydrolase [Desulfobacterales bacterium]MBF0396242.1 alpha/beta hydrolase [Desulfobacterales bacterium]
MNAQYNLVFIHGLESSSNGTKGSYFRKKYQDMIIEDFEGTLGQRMNKLNLILKNIPSLVLIGSSFGGLMATIYAMENREQIKKLILLAPALSFHEFKSQIINRIEVPTLLIHGINDQVVEPDSVKQIAQSIFFNLNYMSVDDDHSLHKTFLSLDWDNLIHQWPAALIS